MPRREHNTTVVTPEPYIHCPFVNNANDIKGHLVWDNVVNLTYSIEGAKFIGNSYLRSRNRVQASKIKTIVYYGKFDTIPIDGDSSTWLSTHFIIGNNNTQNSIYGMLQHYSAENVEFTNCIRVGSWIGTVLTTPFDSTQINTWYKIAIRKNTNNTDLYIDNYHLVSNYIMTDSWYMDIYLGTNSAAQRYLKGNIKDFMAWDIALTDEQLAAL